MKRWWGALAAGLLLVLVTPLGAAAAPGVVASGLKVTPGKVDFALALNQLPEGADLSEATVTVNALGRELPAVVTMQGSGSGGAPDPGSSPGPGSSAAPRSVMVVFDAGGSMAEGSALAAARTAAAGYAAALPADVALGLIAVSERPTTLVEPTRDRNAFTSALSRIAAKGDTALYDGIRQAVAALPAGERRIVLLSDGKDTSSTTKLDALTATLAGQRIPVDVVSLGAKVDPAALAKLTGASGGHTYAARHTSKLAAAFQEAARSFTARLLVTAQVPDALAGKRASMRVSVAVAGVTLTTTVQATFAALPATDARPEVTPQPAQASWVRSLVLGLTFVLLFIVCAMIVNPVLVGAPRRRRMAQVDRYVGRPAAPASAPGVVTRTALEWSQRAIRASRNEDRIVHRLDRAGMSVRPASGC